MISCGGAFCVNGACAGDCGGLTACGGLCAYPDDPHNCGTCGNACDGLCRMGKCMNGSPSEQCGSRTP